MTEERLYTLDEANAELADLRERLPRLRVARDGLIAASERDGRRVYLCWRLGEGEVAWYHEATAGFGNRKPL